MANKVTAFQVQGNTYGVDADLTFDTTPTAGSTNPVTSNGIKVAVDGAAVGTSISVGRTDGTPIGYCSIAYGSDNIAAADYSIVFGSGNRIQSESSIASGDSNISAFGKSNLVIGDNNTLGGKHNVALGVNNSIGTTIQDVSSSDMYSPDIYMGYFNPQVKKLYYDPEMTSEHEITFRNDQGTTYIVDLTNGSGRTPGTIYEYTKYPNKNIGVVKMANQYVHLTDICHNFTYIYRGVCYYDTANDKAYQNYSGGEFSGDLEDEALSIRPQYGQIWFDLISGQFLTYRGDVEIINAISNPPKWVKVKAYLGYTVDVNYAKNGRYAYVWTDATKDNTKLGRVYSSPDFSDESEITSQILDGELVTDIYGTGLYYYRFTIDKVLAYVVDVYSSSNKSTDVMNHWYIFPPTGDSASVYGNGNYTTGSIGSIVAGTGNKATRASEGSAIFGAFNTVSVGPGGGGALYSLVSGNQNTIITPYYGFHTSMVIGSTNSIELYPGRRLCDNIYIAGSHNGVNGEICGDIGIYGAYNTLITSRRAMIFGSNNTIGHYTDTTVLGDYNTLSGIQNWTITKLEIDKDGSYKDIPYDESTQLYTFDTSTIYKLYGIPEDFNNYDDRTVKQFLGYRRSTDGHTLITVQENQVVSHNPCYIFGYHNSYYRSSDDFTNNRSSNYNYMIGAENVMYGNGTQCAGLIGYGLKGSQNGPYGQDLNSVRGAVYVGTYNETNNGSSADKVFANQAQFVVGIGTGDDDRKNGFCVYNTGLLAAPNCPDSIAEAMSKARWNSQKMLVTYGMLKDYAPGTPGAVGKPSVGVLTLNVDDWVSFEQTVSITGIKPSSVVIAQANGNPHTYNANDIYLKTVGTDELVFGCSTVPSVAVSVKVVYWA